MNTQKFFILFLLLGLLSSANAQFLIHPNYDAEPVKSLVEGLTHPHICVAPDGWYYLTGTVGDPQESYANDGIYMWKSKDLKEWKKMGKVFDISEITWQKRGEPIYGTNHLKRHVGCRGAELHFVKGEYYLVYSTVYQSFGILKSKTGKAEGLYEGWSKLLPLGYDPSLFEDEDEKVYLTWNGGMIAGLSNDLKNWMKVRERLSLKSFLRKVGGNTRS